jgi:Uma2 family endonuclease
MATPVLIPVSEYLNKTYRPDCDYIDGEVRERNMGEQQHSRLQLYLGSLFFMNSETWGIRALTEQRVQISDSHYRIADLCILREGDPSDPIVRKAPLLCIEILSRGDTLQEMQQRVDDYLGMGVEYVWVIDPIRREAFLGSRQGFTTPNKDIFSIPETPIKIPVADIFRQLDLLAAGR